jgi:hypothetical protein
VIRFENPQQLGQLVVVNWPVQRWMVNIRLSHFHEHNWSGIDPGLGTNEEIVHRKFQDLQQPHVTKGQGAAENKEHDEQARGARRELPLQ